MVISIGIDTVTISNVERFLHNQRYVDDIFTEEEQRRARTRSSLLDTYARHFAAKQAVKKVLEHFMDTAEFEYKQVEILFDENKLVYIKPNDEIKAILDSKGVKSMMLSITSEGDNATAFVFAQQ